jgi:hypothetical protein
MDQEDYLFILRALSGNKDTDKSTTIKMDNPTWDAKYVKNKDLEIAFEMPARKLPMFPANQKLE